MITHDDIGKLLGVRAAGPAVLSLYLRVPQHPSALPGLPGRAGELVARARGSTDDPDAAAAQEEDWRIARRMLEGQAREWLGGTIGLFACGEPRLAETIVLPPALTDRAVFATRPHVRPLLLARQRPASCDAAAGGPGRRLPGQVPGPAREALTAIGLQSCLAAVNQRAAGLLIVPENGMIPGFVCQRCAMLSSTGTDCPDWGAASLAVPDLIEEMVVAALEDGAEVQTVADPPGGIAARLRFPLAADGQAALPAATA